MSEITEKLSGIKSNLFDTLSLANETTGVEDANLGDAVARLARNYATDAHINELIDAKLPTATQIKTYAKQMLTSDTDAWTPEEQAKAQERMGIYPMSEEGY